jgi:hypothetical protein
MNECVLADIFNNWCQVRGGDSCPESGPIGLPQQLALLAVACELAL